MIPQSRIYILCCWHAQNLAGHGSFLLFIHLSWIHVIPNVISTYPQLHSILHCFIKNFAYCCNESISYFQSVHVTFLHTLLKLQLSKAKLYSQYTLKTVGTDFSLLGKPISNENHKYRTNNSKEENVFLHKAMLLHSVLATFRYLEILISLHDSSLRNVHNAWDWLYTGSHIQEVIACVSGFSLKSCLII